MLGRIKGGITGICSWQRRETSAIVLNQLSRKYSNAHAKPDIDLKSMDRSVLKNLIQKGPALQDFIRDSAQTSVDATAYTDTDSIPYLPKEASINENRKVHIETYGCQMNFADTEIVHSILNGAGFEITESSNDADVVLLNTCAIREGAEQKIWQRLKELRSLRRQKKAPPVTGLLGCMAERLKEKLLEAEKGTLCQIVVGPDSYRDLPRMLYEAEDGGQKAMNTMLSLHETYADISPLRPARTKVSAFVSIMRGCNNMCSYCIVPFTRGRERSRPMDSILDEIRHISSEGYKEVVLLGQNVNSYNDLQTSNYDADISNDPKLTPGFKSIVQIKPGGIRFHTLVEKVAEIDPEMRIRFTSPHPKDFPLELLQLIRDKPNVCRSIHVPAQSGSSKVLESMRRGYTREAYDQLIGQIRSTISDCALSSDFISGFCGETEEDHKETLSLVKQADYDQAFMFAYSMREKTHAHRKLLDDVPESVKQRRLAEVIDLHYRTLKEKNEQEIGKQHLLLIEGPSKRSDDFWFGRTDTNKKVVIPQEEISITMNSASKKEMLKPGDYVIARVTEGGVTLKGRGIAKTTLTEYYNKYPYPDQL